MFSPTPEHREAFGARDGREIRHRVQGLRRAPKRSTRARDIVAGLTDSAVPVLDGSAAREGRACNQHRRFGDARRGDARARRRVFAFRRCAGAVKPSRARNWRRTSRLGGASQPTQIRRRTVRKKTRARYPARRQARHPRRSDSGQANRAARHADQITYSERGNLQGAQFFAVAGQGLRAARSSAGLGRRNPDRVVPADHPKLTGSAGGAESPPAVWTGSAAMRTKAITQGSVPRLTQLWIVPR